MMLVGFDTNILVYTLRTPGNTNLDQARDLVNRAARSASVGLLLQSLTEFSHVAIRNLRMDVYLLRLRFAAFPRVAAVPAPADEDLTDALDLVRAHRRA